MRPKIDMMERAWKNSNFWVHLNKAPIQPTARERVYVMTRTNVNSSTLV
jgi:hypothetical protein